MWRHTPLVPAQRRQRQADLCKFKASQSNTLTLLRRGGWRDASEEGSTCCPSRGPEVSSQHAQRQVTITCNSSSGESCQEWHTLTHTHNEKKNVLTCTEMGPITQLQQLPTPGQCLPLSVFQVPLPFNFIYQYLSAYLLKRMTLSL